MQKLLKEFKDFAVGGSVVELAVAFVLATAFGALVKALVDFVIMPIVGILFGEQSFSDLILTINDSVILYGAFITALVTFVMIAAAVFFFIVKPYQAYQARQASGEEPPPEPSEEVTLLREIRDGLGR